MGLIATQTRQCDVVGLGIRRNRLCGPRLALARLRGSLRAGREENEKRSSHPRCCESSK